MPIRVAQVVNNLNPGGLERVALNLCHLLDPAGFELHLICLDGAGKLFDEAGLPPERICVLEKPKTRAKVWASLPARALAMGRFLRERRIEVLHSHNATPLLLGGLARSFLRPRPAHVYSEHNQINSATPAFRHAFPYVSRGADVIVAVSRDLQCRLIDDCEVPRPVRVIYNGIDDRAFRGMTDDQSFRAELGLAPDDVLVLTAVRLVEAKGLPYLVEAATQVLRESPRAVFVLAGQGPKEAEIKALVAKAGLGDRFRMLGFRSDVSRLIMGCDVYAMSSLWEGLPLALLEALAAGKTIVCTAVGGNAEVVEDRVNGRLVPSKDGGALARALLDVIRDPEFRAATRARNKAKFDRTFRLEAMISAHAKLYRELAPRT